MRSFSKAIVVFLLLVIFSAAFLDYWGYSTLQKLHPESWLDIVAGQAQAPVQYRIGVILPAYWITQHSPLAFRHVFAFVDLIALCITVFAVFFLLRRSSVYQSSSDLAQIFANSALLGLVEFYIAWLLWYQRPETLLTAAILSLTLLLLTVRLPIAKTLGYYVSATGLLALAFSQSFIRADVAFSLHFGVLMICLFLPRTAVDFALPKWLQATVSLLAAGMCGIIQFYLVHVRYPAAVYQDGPIIQLFNNLKTPSEWPPFVLLMTPIFWTIGMVWRHRERIAGPSLSFLSGAIIFLSLWIVAGRVEEVRIFLPFALGLSPLTITLALERFGKEDYVF